MKISTVFRVCYSVFCLFILGQMNAQEQPLVIKQDSTITQVLNLKIEANKEQFANEVYSIQLYYGKYDRAQEIIDAMKTAFPTLSPEIGFETPNYKVQVGPFEAYLDALEELKRLKAVYREAFILQPKREL